MKTSIPKVCLGNISHSPQAKDILKIRTQKEHFSIELEGTFEYQIDQAFNSKSTMGIAHSGIDVRSQKVRKSNLDDFDRFYKIFVIDRNNLHNIQKIVPTKEDLNKVILLLENDRGTDPHNGNENSLKKVFESIDQGCDHCYVTFQKKSHDLYHIYYS